MATRSKPTGMEATPPPPSGGLRWAAPEYGFQTGTSKAKQSRKGVRATTMDQPLARQQVQRSKNLWRGYVYYATDSASMLAKAKKLIAAARHFEEKNDGAGRAPSEGKQVRNPFKKPWGVQRDGDLWAQAWKAVLKRGSANQDLRKGERARNFGKCPARKGYEGRQTRQRQQRRKCRQGSRRHPR